MNVEFTGLAWNDRAIGATRDPAFGGSLTRRAPVFRLHPVRCARVQTPSGRSGPMYSLLLFDRSSAEALAFHPSRQAPPTLGLEHGTQDFETPDFILRIGKDAGVAVSLRPKGKGEFDFLPSDRLGVRSGDGSVHLGDLTFRARPEGALEWMSGDTSAKRAKVAALRPIWPTLAAEDLAASLPADSPLRIVRRWAVQSGRLQLLFDVINPGKKPVEMGALGFAMPFNNILSGRSLEEAHARCSFTDPYLGEDAGYLQVTRLTGTGPTMVVTPVGKTPLEAWRPLREPMPPEQTFEGTMEWMVHTKAWAEHEWKGATPWNEPTGAILGPGERRTYGVQFTPTPSIRKIEATLASLGRPVAVGIPGYVLPQDESGRLFLKYGSPVRAIAVEPRGAMVCKANGEGGNGYRSYSLRAKGRGRARLTVDYADGTRQTVSYYLTKPAAAAVADLGRFLTTKAWFTDADDPFGRAPSAITYDEEKGAQVRQDSRVWVAGLGDEGGSGAWLALGMKEFGQPDAGEIRKYDEFIDRVLWGNLQFKDGPKKYGVRKSVFFYQPDLLPAFRYDPRQDWTSWTSWNKASADDVGRGYDYPHVVAAYWSMYRVARNHPGLTKHPWEWYLDQAYATTEFLTSEDATGRDRVGYWRLGLMDGTVFVNLLDDLRREGWTRKADLIEARMRLRADRWKDEAYPFGSEMAWDSTGQEEVYAWCRRFGYEDKAQVSLSSILAYDPTVPHWGYNGNARRYWDFLYGGKLRRIERQIHHYGSGLNAIPLLTEYRAHPDDLYLLRVGYGGMMGALSNIHQDGFASVAFHSYPDTLKWDAFGGGDYGPNFFGLAQNTAAYLVNTPDFGWQAFGADVSSKGGWVTVRPRDSFRTRVYLAPVGLYLTLDSGTFASVSFNPTTRTVRATIEAAGGPARLRVETTAAGMSTYEPVGSYATDAGAYTIPAVGARSLLIEPVSSLKTANAHT